MLITSTKLVLSFCGFILTTGTLVAQNATEPIQPSQQQGVKSEKSTGISVEASSIFQKYLGLTSSTDPEYAERKLKLKEENPEAYAEMVKEMTALRSTLKTVLTRAQYDALPVERKAYIDANPSIYSIQD